jgi:hypothetical protein
MRLPKKLPEVTSYQCLEALRRARERGPQSDAVVFWRRVLGSLLAFVGV